MVKVTCRVSVVPRASFTVIVDFVTPARVGVPVTVPSGFSVTPAGSALALYAYGSRPPVALIPQLTGVASFMLTVMGWAETGVPLGARPRSSGASTKIPSCFVSLAALTARLDGEAEVAALGGCPGDHAVRVERQARRERTARERPRADGRAGRGERRRRIRLVDVRVGKPRTSRRPAGACRRVDVDDEPIVRRRLAAARSLVVFDGEIEVVASRRGGRPADDALIRDGQPGRERARRDGESSRSRNRSPRGGSSGGSGE